MFADDPILAALQQARKLILAKKYDEARAILRPLDDPKAKSWLAQIDKIAPEMPKPAAIPDQPAQAGTPATPSAQSIEDMLEPEYKRNANMPIQPGSFIRQTWIRIAVILLGGLPLLVVGVLMSLNWRRLGKPQWVWGSLLALLIPAGLFAGVAFGSAALNLSNVISTGLLIGTGVMALYVFGAIYALQNGAYETWKSGGRQALQAHRYPIEQTALIGLVLVALATVGASAYRLIRTQPKTYESADVSLVYSGDWEMQDITQYDDCKLGASRCLFALWKTPPFGTQMLATSFDVDDGVTSESLAQAFLSYLQTRPPKGNVKMQPPGTQIVGGQRATTIEYNVTDPVDASVNNRTQDYEELLVVIGHTAYEFRVVSARCLSCAPTYRGEIDELLAGLQFKNL